VLDAKEKMHQELLTAADYIQEVEEKCYKSAQTSLEILSQLRNTEVEVETLK